MMSLTPSAYFELFLGLFLWWVAIYLITQNPFSRAVQIAFGIIASASFYFSGDIFLILGKSHHEIYTGAVKAFIWSMYLPLPLLYHASFTCIPKNDRRSWQRWILILSYIAAAVIFLVDTQTNLIRNYAVFTSGSFTGSLDEGTGQYFWLVAAFIIPVEAAIGLNFFAQSRKHPIYSQSWNKFFYPFLGILASMLLGPFTILSYYNIIPYSNNFSALEFLLVILPLVYSIIRHGLFIEEIEIVFGKTFLYSTLVTVFMVLVFFLAIVASRISLATVQNFVFLYVLSYLIILLPPAYSWLTTFARDLIYDVSAGLSVVNDEEVYQALRDYHYPEKLENSSLLRLNCVAKGYRKGNTPVDTLRKIVKEAIEYYTLESSGNRRTKQNVKSHLLKMLAFDEAEEGQILWELGFEEYPVRIMTKVSSKRPPLFQINSPSDYTYTSRNAYLALKKEAIHDITWRISYLEKLSKR